VKVCYNQGCVHILGYSYNQFIREGSDHSKIEKILSIKTKLDKNIAPFLLHSWLVSWFDSNNLYENMSYENDFYYPPTDRDDETAIERILNNESQSELTKDIRFLVKKSKRISKQNSCEITFLIVLFLVITGNLVLSGLIYFSRDSKGRVNNWNYILLLLISGRVSKVWFKISKSIWVHISVWTNIRIYSNIFLRILIFVFDLWQFSKPNIIRIFEILELRSFIFHF